jgi:FixJ family two-component response regulator
MPPRTVVIVDDDCEVLTTLEGMLRSAGHRVVSYASGEACLEDLGQHEPDVLLTDLRMPGMSGLQLAEQVARLRPALPVVYLTGADSQPRGDRPENVRASLGKPVGIRELELLLARILSPS